ncbi:MAG: hypothetical protein ACTH0S_08630 [Senegalia sp. (in: firmicutes)]
MMYRFLLFRYNKYYPIGGIADVELKFNEIEELSEWVAANEHFNYDTTEIYNVKKDRVYRIDSVDNIVEELEEYLKPVYALCFYLDTDGIPAQLKASRYLEDLEHTKDRMEKKNNGKRYEIKTIEEFEKEREIIYKANEVLDGMDMSDEMKDAVRESTIKHDDIYKGLVDR